MQFWKKKNLSILTLVTILVISLFSSVFIGTVAASTLPVVTPGDPNIASDEYDLGQYQFGVPGFVPLKSPEPDIDFEGSDYEAAEIVDYRGYIKECDFGILAVPIYNNAFFAWWLFKNGTYSARIEFKCEIKFWAKDGGPWTEDLTYIAGEAGVDLIVGDGEGEGGGDSTCFMKGTKILMGNLSVKNIEDIEVDDIVKTMDMVTGEIGNDSVFELLEHSDEEMTNGCVEITIENKFRVTVTPDHPIPVMEDDFEELLESSDPNITTDGTEFAFIRAGDLEVGDRVYCGNVTNIVEYPEAKAESYSLILKENLTYIVACTPLYQQQYEPPSGQFAQELDDWKALTLEMNQTGTYYPVMAPAVKGNPESYVYFEGLGEYFEERVGAYALPMLEPSEE